MNMPDLIEESRKNALCQYGELKNRYDALMMKYAAVCKERDELRKELNNIREEKSLYSELHRLEQS